MADREVTEPAEGTSPFASSSSADPVDAIAAALRDGDEPPTESATSPPQAARARRLPRMARGTVIGRYVVIDLLGKGGMGDVYAAYDPELDRRIALKLVRDLTGQGRERLIAEAKAMARVSHPNVCAVHDAGRFAEGVFIAMELVDGQTLTAWRRTARGWREILAVFAAAGAGLCEMCIRDSPTTIRPPTSGSLSPAGPSPTAKKPSKNASPIPKPANASPPK